MPSFNTIQLIDECKKDVVRTLSVVEKLSNIPEEKLFREPGIEKWSVVQVLEHLNGYNRFYLIELENAISNNVHHPIAVFRSGMLGNYFTKMMAPKEGSVTNKMKAPKDYTYTNDLNVEKVLAEFKEGQQKLLKMLDQVKERDLNRIKLPISISKLIKLKMGDVIRFLIAHQVRHFIQVDNTLKQV